MVNIVYLGQLAFPYLKTDVVLGGWDGVAAFVVNEAYSDQIFPNLAGSLPNWNMGQTWPVGYTPLMTYGLSFLSNLFNVEFVSVMKVFAVFLGLVYPLVMYWALRRMGLSRIPGFLGGILLISYMYAANETLALSYRALLVYGNYTYVLGSVFLLFLVGEIGRFKLTVRSAVLASLWLSMAILSNLHLGIVSSLCLFVGLVMSVTKLNLRLNLRYLAIVVVNSVSILALWLIPLVATKQYFFSYTQISMNFSYVIESAYWPVLLLALGCCGFTLYKQKSLKNLVWLTIVSVILTIILIFPMNSFAPGLPWQPHRMYSLIYLILIVLIANSLRYWKKYYHYVGAVLVLIVLILTPLRSQYIGEILPLTKDEQNLLAFTSNLSPGRIIIESSGWWYSRLGILTNLIGRGVPVIWGTFRESAINMPYIQPVRGSVSYDAEYFGITCWLCPTNFYAEEKPIPESASIFHSVDFETKLQRAAMLGGKYLVIETESIKVEAEQSGLLNLVGEFGKWSVYEITLTPSLVESLSANQLLVFTEINPGYRGQEDYDWHRLNEQWLTNGSREHLLVMANDQLLDSTNDFNYFDHIFITKYRYGDLHSAYLRLLELAKTKTIYLLESTDPLFAAMTHQPVNNVIPLYKSEKLSKNVDRILTDLESTDGGYSVMQSIISPNRISVYNAQPNSYIHVNYSYFPWWTSDNSRIYLASPATMLAINDTNTVEIYFETPSFVYLGWLISASGLVVSIILISRRRTQSF